MNVHHDPLGLFDIIVTSVDHKTVPGEVRFFAETPGHRSRCFACMTEPAQIVAHGRDIQIFRDVAFQGKIASIAINRRRLRCTTCRKTWFEAVPNMHDKRRMTQRAVDRVVQNCFDTTNLSVAREFGIDEGTVRNIFLEYIRAKDLEPRPATPRYLGIDEVHLTNARCVLADVENRQIFDILPSITKAALFPYFEVLPDKDNVEAIVADMHRPYHDLAAQFFPGVPVVVDRFHVVRMATRAMEKVRKKVSRSRTPEQRKQLMNERRLFAMRQADLQPHQAEAILPWLKEFPIMLEAYRLKERFHAIYEQDSRQAANKAIDKALLSVPSHLSIEFAEVDRAVRNFRREILNFYDHPITNAYTEGLNSLIRQVERRGRGYDFEVMRGRMLYDETVRDKKTSTRDRWKAAAQSQNDDLYGTINFAEGFGTMADADLSAAAARQGTSIELLAQKLKRQNDAAGFED